MILPAAPMSVCTSQKRVSLQTNIRGRSGTKVCPAQQAARDTVTQPPRRLPPKQAQRPGPALFARSANVSQKTKLFSEVWDDGKHSLQRDQQPRRRGSGTDTTTLAFGLVLLLVLTWCAPKARRAVCQPPDPWASSSASPRGPRRSESPRRPVWPASGQDGGTGAGSRASPSPSPLRPPHPSAGDRKQEDRTRQHVFSGRPSAARPSVGGR